MNDMILTATRARMQSEILGLRLVDALEAASLADQQDARDARRYAQRVRFAMRRVDELRASAQREGTLFEAARLDVALNILEGHVFRAADFVDGIARRQRSELARVNRRIAGEAEPAITPAVAQTADRHAA